jgi:hypothetical protein
MRTLQFGRLPFGFACALIVGGCGDSGPIAPTPQAVSVSGRVHEAPPTAETAIGDAHITVMGGVLGGRVFVTDDQGRFVLPPVAMGNFALTFEKRGYETTRIEVRDLPRTGLDVGILPERREVGLSVSGTNDCVDLPLVQFNIGDAGTGGRLYSRMPVHHDGVIRVRRETLRLPFSIGVYGSVLRLLPSGAVEQVNSFPNTDVPVTGGYVYLILFGGDVDLCSAWAMDATHPS